MSKNIFFNLINRIEMLLDEADDLISKYPYIDKKRGFIENVGLTFSGNLAERERIVERRLQAIFSEILGIIATLKESLRAYGIYLKNDNIATNIENARNYSQAISAMRSAVGYMRSKIMSI